MSKYKFQGWAKGQFENDKGEKQPYANIYVINKSSHRPKKR